MTPPAASTETCVTAFPAICVRWDATVPFWELLATLLVTAAVTYFTITWSVRAARAETNRTLRASLRAEARARREKEAEQNAERESAAEAARHALAERLLSASMEMEARRTLPRKDTARISIEARWEALKYAFAAARLPEALELYEFAALVHMRADAIAEGDWEVESTVTRLLLQQATGLLRKPVSEWAANGVLPDSVTRQSAELRRRKLKLAESAADSLRSAIETLQNVEKAVARKRSKPQE